MEGKDNESGLPPWGQKESDVNSINPITNFTQRDFTSHTTPGGKQLWQDPGCLTD